MFPVLLASSVSVIIMSSFNEMLRISWKPMKSCKKRVVVATKLKKLLLSKGAITGSRCRKGCQIMLKVWGEVTTIWKDTER